VIGAEEDIARWTADESPYGKARRLELAGAVEDK
jgi:hypothetical protein